MSRSILMKSTLQVFQRPRRGSNAQPKWISDTLQWAGFGAGIRFSADLACSFRCLHSSSVELKISGLSVLGRRALLDLLCDPHGQSASCRLQQLRLSKSWYFSALYAVRSQRIRMACTVLHQSDLFPRPATASCAVAQKIRCEHFFAPGLWLIQAQRGRFHSALGTGRP